MDSRHSSLLRVVTQQSHWGGALRDDPKNGCDVRDSKVREILKGAARHLLCTWQFSLALGYLVRTTIPEAK